MVDREIKAGLFHFHTKGDMKTLVNNGIWFMYSVESPLYPKAEYLLEADGSNFLLKKNGSVLASVDYTSKIRKKARIYFDGVPFPEQMPRLCQE